MSLNATLSFKYINIVQKNFNLLSTYLFNWKNKIIILIIIII